MWLEKFIDGIRYGFRHEEAEKKDILAETRDPKPIPEKLMRTDHAIVAGATGYPDYALSRAEKLTQTAFEDAQITILNAYNGTLTMSIDEAKVALKELNTTVSSILDKDNINVIMRMHKGDRNQ